MLGAAVLLAAAVVVVVYSGQASEDEDAASFEPRALPDPDKEDAPAVVRQLARLSLAKPAADAEAKVHMTERVLRAGELVSTDALSTKVWGDCEGVKDADFIGFPFHSAQAFAADLPEIYLKRADPAGGCEGKAVQVLLLHGAAFSVSTWDKLGTLQFLGASGGGREEKDALTRRSTPVHFHRGKWLLRGGDGPARLRPLQGQGGTHLPQPLPSGDARWMKSSADKWV